MGRFVGKIYTLTSDEECDLCAQSLDAIILFVEEHTGDHCEDWDECKEVWELSFGEAYCWDVTISPEMLRYEQ